MRHAFGYTVTDAVTTAPRTLTRGQARLFAFTAGATCANLYYAQPLLPTIAATGIAQGTLLASYGLIAAGGAHLGRRTRLRAVGLGGRLRGRRRVSRPRVAVLASRGSSRAPF